MNIYVASSWRNTYQPEVVQFLRSLGHEVYDFRNPRPGDVGFAWRDVPGAPPATLDQRRRWEPGVLREVLKHPVAQAGFKSDMDALRAADLVVLVLPCGKSAHLEAGWAAGAQKPVVVYQPEPDEPDLMYLMGDGIVVNLVELAERLPDFEGYREVRHGA